VGTAREDEVERRPQRRFAAFVLVAAVVASSAPLGAATVATRYTEAPTHAFLVLSDTAGKALASGEIVQWQERNGLTNRLVFRFDDGSLYDETVRFTQRPILRLLSYHLVQHGPAFDKASDVTFDRSGRYTASERSGDGKEDTKSGNVDVPADVYNGMTSTLLRNLPDGAGATAHLLAFTPSPSLVELTLAPEGTDAFWIGRQELTATRFVVTPRVVGVKGVLASVVGKQPAPLRFWLSKGRVPTFVRFQGPLYAGGPEWRIALAAARWRD
jgi:hypothetical protein